MLSVVVVVLTPEVEILQSAEVLRRELLAHGVPTTDAGAIQLTLSAELLQSGQVELVFPQKNRRSLVNLEDCVELVAAWAADGSTEGNGR